MESDPIEYHKLCYLKVSRGAARSSPGSLKAQPFINTSCIVRFDHLINWHETGLCTTIQPLYL
jgi:hypothetical protein